MLNCLCVGLGGFLGAVFRYLLGMLPLSERFEFPFVTFGINILGAFVIGVVSEIAVKYGMSDSRMILLLKTGVCGGFTTFSTFSLESSSLISAGKYGIAICYIVCSVAACLLAVIAGKYVIQ